MDPHGPTENGRESGAKCSLGRIIESANCKAVNGPFCFFPLMSHQSSPCRHRPSIVLHAFSNPPRSAAPDSAADPAPSRRNHHPTSALTARSTLPRADSAFEAFSCPRLPLGPPLPIRARCPHHHLLLFLFQHQNFSSPLHHPSCQTRSADHLKGSSSSSPPRPPQEKVPKMTRDHAPLS